MASAALGAGALALPIVAIKVIREGYPPALALFSFAIPRNVRVAQAAHQSGAPRPSPRGHPGARTLWP